MSSIVIKRFGESRLRGYPIVILSCCNRSVCSKLLPGACHRGPRQTCRGALRLESTVAAGTHHVRSGGVRYQATASFRRAGWQGQRRVARLRAGLWLPRIGAALPRRSIQEARIPRTRPEIHVYVQTCVERCPSPLGALGESGV